MVARTLAETTGATLIAALVTVLLTPAPAAARSTADQVFLELRPSTIQAGHQIGLRANCGDKHNPATVRSEAFGEVVLSPRNQQWEQPEPGTPDDHDQGLLTGTAAVPTSTLAGEYPVELRCADGGRASATLFVLDMARPTRGPDTGLGGTADGAAEGPVNEPGRLTGWLVAITSVGGVAAIGVGTIALLSLRRPPTRQPSTRQPWTRQPWTRRPPTRRSWTRRNR